MEEKGSQKEPDSYAKKGVADWNNSDFCEFVRDIANVAEYQPTDSEQEQLNKNGLTGELICAKPLTMERLRGILPLTFPYPLREKIYDALKIKLPSGVAVLLPWLLKQLEETVLDDTVCCPNCKILISVDTNKQNPTKCQVKGRYMPWYCSTNNQLRVFGREGVKTQLESALQTNHTNAKSRSQEKQSFIICSALGFVGIGKTTVGQRVASQLELNSVKAKYIYIDFSSGDSLTLESAEPKHLAEFSLHLSLRVFTQLFLGLSYQHAIARYGAEPFIAVQKQLEKELVPLSTILHYWRKASDNYTCPFIVHFDEVNYLSPNGRKLLIDYIGATFMPDGEPITLLPLITGTSSTTEEVISLSKYSKMKLVLSPLTRQAQEEITITDNKLHEQLANSLKGSERFKLLLRSSLGVPRIVMQLKGAIAHVELTGTEVTPSQMEKIAERFIYNVELTYNINTWLSVLQASEKAILQLICLCLRGQLHVDSSCCSTTNLQPKITAQVPGFAYEIESLPSTSIEIATLYDEGYFFTVDNKSLGYSQQIQFPYVLLSSLVGAIAKSSLSTLLSPLKTIQWQELEELEPKFLQLLVESFNAMKKGLKVKFSDIWRGAKTTPNVMNVTLKIPDHLENGLEEHQWLKKGDDGTYSAIDWPMVKCTNMDLMDLRNTSGSFIACAGNPLFNVRTVFEISYDDDEDESTDEAEREVKGPTKKRTATSKSPKKKLHVDRPLRLINLTQMKVSSNPKKIVKASEIHEWYNQAKLLDLDGFLVVFTYYTNNGIQWDKRSTRKNSALWTEASLLAACPNLVLMHQDQLNEYLSPTFAPLCRPKEDN